MGCWKLLFGFCKVVCLRSSGKVGFLGFRFGFQAEAGLRLVCVEQGVSGIAPPGNHPCCGVISVLAKWSL